MVIVSEKILFGFFFFSSVCKDWCVFTQCLEQKDMLINIKGIFSSLKNNRVDVT